MPGPRRFRLVDASILIAATALGLADFRYVQSQPIYPLLLRDLERGDSIVRRFLTASGLLMPTLAAWTAAVVASQLVPPRPPLRRIARQPGAADCGVALLVLTVEAVGIAASLLADEAARGRVGSAWTPSGFADGFASFSHEVLAAARDRVGFAVLAAWVVLWAGRSGRPERSWIDRLGRGLGVCWIAADLASWVYAGFLQPKFLPHP